MLLSGSCWWEAAGLFSGMLPSGSHWWEAARPSSHKLRTQACKAGISSSLISPDKRSPALAHKAELEGAGSRVLLKAAPFLLPQPQPTEVKEQLFMALSRLWSQALSSLPPSLPHVRSSAASAVITHAQHENES